MDEFVAKFWRCLDEAREAGVLSSGGQFETPAAQRWLKRWIERNGDGRD